MSNHRFIQRVLATDAGLGPLALRIPIGLIFAAHGAQKLFGWFGGYGLEGTGQFFGSIGLNPGYLMALLAGGAEFFGGLALVLGVLVRPAAASLAFAMLIAIFSVHFSKGFFLDKGGYEYALALFTASLSLLFSGAGRFSADAALARQHATSRTLSVAPSLRTKAA
jgi:putative oxidoreductase